MMNNTNVKDWTELRVTAKHELLDTVCAVMTKAPADSYLTVGMQTDTYRALTAEDGARDLLRNTSPICGISTQCAASCRRPSATKS